MVMHQGAEDYLKIMSYVGTAWNPLRENPAHPSTEIVSPTGSYVLTES